MSSESVRVQLGPRSYDIEIGTGNLRDAARLIRQNGVISHAVLITDENVRTTHAATVSQSLQEATIRTDVQVVPAGEKSKSVAMADRLWNELAQLGADRKTVVVAVGGGVVGDLAGFVAATYARGLRFVQIPTTLLAQVDSSVGGKVGINLPTAKNMVGAFWQPNCVLIDTNVLTTLPEREYRAGLAEVVKYGVILDADFFAYLESHINDLNSRDPQALRTVVAKSCVLKASVVEQDEREETGLRAVLNYGHTFAHALETVTSYGTLLHGEAVAIGMACAARMARALGRIDDDAVRRQHTLLEALGLPTSVPQIDGREVWRAMMRDKKVEHGRLRFVLPTRLGHVELVGNIDSTYAIAALQS